MKENYDDSRKIEEGPVPRPEHPRPDFQRASWHSLNGAWEFSFDDDLIGRAMGWDLGGIKLERTIVVPFVYQSRLSGIADESVHEVVWYRKVFELPAAFAEKRVLLHFGAVDWKAEVWMNGRSLGQHVGGSTPFSFDITPFLTEGEQVVVVKATDPQDAGQPRGKQSWQGKRFGCWYTPSTGIWQSVWIEAVGKCAISRLSIDADVDRRTATVEYGVDTWSPGLEMEARVSYEGRDFGTFRATAKERTSHLAIEIDWPDNLPLLSFLWEPGKPRLFDLRLTLLLDGEPVDQVDSYFAFRKIGRHNGQILINNVPIEQNLVLDQGYWPDGLMTAPSDDAFRKDIELAMSFGFNGARKHQKIEDPRYYYWADRLGFLVWGEMPSCYRFDATAISRTLAQWQEFIARDRGHACIVVWVPMNESWGVDSIMDDKPMQDYCEALYRLTKAIDPTRLVSSNDGWEQVHTDICAIHDYEASGRRFIEKTRDKESYLATKSDWKSIYCVGYSHEGEPVALTEWGGIAFSGLSGDQWGYNGAVETSDQFLDRFKGMVLAIRRAGFFVGHCYTQLTDVQQEVNGLLTADREPKVDPDEIRRILESRS